MKRSLKYLAGAVTDVRVASRNLVRNRRRTLIGIVTIAFGVIALVLANGFIQWVFWAMRESVIQYQLGHIQVTRPGYNSAGAANPFAHLLPEHSAERTAIQTTPGVKLVAPRLAVSGLISHGETTVAFLGDGVGTKKETALDRSPGIVDGKDLSVAGANEVILGRGLARTLDVRPGDTVVLLANTESGGINAVEARVAGLFVSANSAYDNSALQLPIKLAQSLLRIDGVHMWLLLLHDTDQTDFLMKQFRAQFPRQTSGLEFAPWYAHADFYNKTVALFSKQMNVLRLIIALIIILSISNMLTMNVMERTGEIGTLLAIGLKRKKILQVFATEGLLLGLIGGFAGIAIGYGLAELISTIGIPMPPPPGREEGYTGEIRITGTLLAGSFVIAVTTTLLASLYPAWKASRQQIVDALRHNV